MDYNETIVFMKDICLVTGFNDLYYDIAKNSIPNFLNYCNIHNVDLHISTKNYYNEKYNWGWNKYKIIDNVIDSYEWILWIDIDCLFVDRKKDIRSLIDNNYSLIIGENKNAPDWYVEDKSYIENGVFLIKNDNFGKNMLNRFMTDPIDHPWHDQYKMILELRNNEIFNKRTKKLDLIEINAIDGIVNDSCFIYHCAGGSSKTIVEKIELIKKHSEK